MLLKSLPLVIGSRPRVLILGSMPGARSLAAEEYYAHPRNRFWPVMEALLDVEARVPYPERVEQLKAARVALWDVLKHCRREGSLDRKISVRSEEANEVADLLTTRDSLGAVALNGRKATAAFERLILPNLSTSVRERVAVLGLPSTSPANARADQRALVDSWRTMVPYLSGDADILTPG